MELAKITVGRDYESLTVTSLGDLHVPLLGDLPLLGPVLFQQNLVVYLSLLLAVVIGFTLTHTRLGLAIRSVGENPGSAQALGFPVHLIRYCSVAFGVLLAGFAGAYASTISVQFGPKYSRYHTFVVPYEKRYPHLTLCSIVTSLDNLL